MQRFLRPGSDCADCIAAILAVGRLVFQYQGSLSFEAAKYMVAVDMYKTNVYETPTFLPSYPLISFHLLPFPLCCHCLPSDSPPGMTPHP